MIKGKPMWYCEKCREWVPDQNKHNNKHHSIELKGGNEDGKTKRNM